MQLVGGEHARLTQAERSIQHLTENYSRLDEENKVLRDQLVRQQQHSNLQIEELLDNAQVTLPYISPLMLYLIATQINCNNKK